MAQATERFSTLLESAWPNRGDKHERALILDQCKVEFRAATSSDWLPDISQVFDLHWDKFPPPVWRTLASDLAWWIRSRRDDDLKIGVAPRIDPLAIEPTSSLFVAYVVGQYLRYDFQFRKLLDFLALLPPTIRVDPLLRALDVFARRGMGLRVAPNDVRALMNEPDCDEKSRFCLLHALESDTGSADFKEIVAELTNSIESRSDTGCILEYRMARAYRHSHQLDLAEHHARRALGFSTPSNLVHLQIEQELLTIQASRDVQRMVDSATEDINRKVSDFQIANKGELDRVARESLVANFQILSVLLTVAGFLGTAGVTIVSLARESISIQRGLSTLALLIVFNALTLLVFRVLVIGLRGNPK